MSCFPKNTTNTVTPTKGCITKTSKCKYSLKVKTGNQSKAGPGLGGGVSVTLTGTKGRTGPHKLSHWFHTDFRKGKEEHFTVYATDVGDLLLVQFDVRKGLFRKVAEWYAEMVSIHDNSRDDKHHYNWGWITHQAVLYHSKALLPTVQQHHLTLDQRRLEIISRQGLYFWADKNTHQKPGFINAATPKDLPKNAQFTDDAARSFVDGAIIGASNLALSVVTTDLVDGFGDSFQDFDDYKGMFVTVKQIPWVAQNGKWQDDRVFGYQFLNGCNPCMLERCEKLPDNFLVTEDMVRSFLNRGLSLQQEMEEGHIYIVNYKELEGLKRLAGRYLPEALGLFYVTIQQQLVPIAIQLYQTPGVSNPIWTPNDSKYEWLLAKMFLRAADNNVHQIKVHLLMTHLMMESVAVATYRQLPSIHPLYKLLFPHIRGTMPINVRARTSLINPGGIVDKAQGLGGGGHIELMERSYKNFTWDSLNIPLTLKKRGVHDAEKLPKFYYRDDAMKLWRAIEEFLNEFVSMTYDSDDDVKNDHELAAWVRDMHDEGFPVREGDVDHKFPESVTSRDQLVVLLTSIIFDGSCQHAAVNFGQLDIYGFIPNAPSIMRQPPPSCKGDVDLKHVMNTLPTREQAGWQIAAAYALTQFADNERYLGNYEDSHFSEDKYKEIIKKHVVKLGEIKEEIDRRNESLDIPYVYLRPDRVPMSVAI